MSEPVALAKPKRGMLRLIGLAICFYIFLKTLIYFWIIFALPGAKIYHSNSGGGMAIASSTTVYGNGLVIVDVPGDTRGRLYTISPVMTGRFEDHIPPSAVVKILQKFSLFDWMLPTLGRREMMYDGPDTVLLEVHAGPFSKRYDQWSWPEPPSGFDVEKIAGTEKFINGGPDLLPWLLNNHFDFHSLAAARLVLESPEISLAAIDRGAPLDRPARDVIADLPPGQESEKVGEVLLERAIGHQMSDVMHRLIRDGWLEKLGKQKAGAAFAGGLPQCDVRFVDDVFSAGIPIDVPGHREEGYSPQLPKVMTEIDFLQNIPRCSMDKNKAVVKYLISHGAIPHHLGKSR